MNGEPGIRPATDKLTRFNMIVPQFKLGKVFFAEELRKSKEVSLFVEQIALVTKDGIKGKDDCIDTISMLQYMNPWAPAPQTAGHNGKSPLNDRNGEFWGSNGLTPQDLDNGGYSSYVI